MGFKNWLIHIHICWFNCNILFLCLFSFRANFFILSKIRAHFGELEDTQLTVKGLQEGKQYEFRVAAINNAGVGDYSDGSGNITANPPPGAFLTISYWFTPSKKIKILKK